MNLNNNTPLTDSDNISDELLPNDNERQLLAEHFRRQHIHVPDVDTQWQSFIDATDDKPASRHFSLWLMGVAVAACAALLFVFTTRHSSLPDDGIEVLASIDNDAGVTLTGSDGTKRQVSAASVSFAKGGARKAYSDNQMLTMKTPRGHECEITLSDGTIVTLYGESSIEFPRQFSGKRRVVKMSGEAYFDVAKDAAHPFVVVNDYFSTSVLGTSFGMRAYSDKDASVTLVEGRVEMNGDNMPRRILSPGQKAQYSAMGFTVENVDTYPLLQHKAGYFYFDNESLLKVMIELGRWYNKTVVFENEHAMQERLHFVAERTQPIEEVVEALNEMDGVNVVLTDEELTVK